jgi:predicted Zn-dependent protease
MDVKDYCFALAERMQGLLRGGEVFTCHFEGERSDFVRLNNDRVRQAGSVSQLELELDLVEGRRHSAGSVNLSGNPADDRALLEELITSLRAQRRHLPDDPHLNYATEVRSTEEERNHGPADSEAALEAIIRAGEGLDLVGLLSSGSLYRAFANSLGQRNWYRTDLFNFDWSVFHAGDKAVKSNYAGFRWEGQALAQRMDAARAHLAIMAQPPKTVPPGRYRVYLAPAALQELFTVLCWGGFGLKSHRTLQTPLIKMVVEGRRLHPAVTLSEHIAGGIAAGFTSRGFLKPPRVTLIEGGAYRNCLVHARSGQEYGLPVNADSEFPQALELAAGALDLDSMLDALGTGVYINNLWYANYSDRNEARMTGITRYACFWVEGGRIQAPLNVMRFDESLYHLLGDRLLGLTRERELLIDPATYHQRSTVSMHLPGALIEDFTFTL